MAEEIETSNIAASSSQMSGAPNYNRWTYEQFAPFLKGEVLEVGCGVGNFSELLLACGAIRRLVNVDISPEAISLCQKRFPEHSSNFRCVDFTELSDSFDTILCMNVLEHIENDLHATRHLLQLLKPGGCLFLLVPSHPLLYNRWDKAVGHYRRYTKSSFNALLREVEGVPNLQKQYYFNSIGALGYWFVYKLMGKEPAPETPSELKFFDGVIVPLQKRIEGTWLPFGLSLINVITKNAADESSDI